MTTLLHYLAGIVPAYFITCYLSTLYDGLVPFLLVSLVSQIACGVVLKVYFGSGVLAINWRKDWPSLLVLTVAASVPVSAAVISLQFPGLFDRRILIMDVKLLPVFLGSLLVSMPVAFWLNNHIEQHRFQRAVESIGLIQFTRRNRAGLLLALLFLLACFILAQSLNFPGFYTRDQYFEMDISDWVSRLTAPPVDEILPVRAVHPAVLLFLRPLTWLLSLPLNGDRLQAAFLLSALAGSACVFMTWLIVKQRTGSTPYALASASLLGASASHLLLASMLETYIFSALALISFCFLMQSGRTSLRSTIPMGVVIFGITITNLAQACILYFLKLPRLKVMLLFILAVASVTLLLNVLQVQLFPFSKPIYNPSNLLVEQKYGSNPLTTSRRMGRLNLVARSVLLYGIAAPTPYILKDELGTTVPNFRTFRITAGEVQVAGYKGFSDIVVKTWILILGAGLLLFAFGLFKAPVKMSYPVSLVLCMGFSLALHFLYGDDPMLYSPNWVYALILFVSCSFERAADKKWIQLAFTVFLGMMVYTKLGLIHEIMSVSLPYYGR